MSKWHKTEFDFYPVSAFKKRAGGGMTLEGGGSSSSSNATDTYNTDRRIVNDSGLVLQGDGNKFDASTTATGNTANSNNDSHNVTNVTDGGAVKSAMDTVTAGVGVVGKGFTDLTNGAVKIFTTASDNQKDTFHDLLGASTTQNNNALTLAGKSIDSNNGAFDKLIGMAGKLFDSSKAQNEAFQTSVAGAYQTAVAEKSGGLDNKTIVILGVAAAAALAFSMRKG